MFVLGLRGVSSIRLELTFQTWILQVWNDKTWMGHIRKSKWNIQEHQLLTLVQSPHNDFLWFSGMSCWLSLSGRWWICRKTYEWKMLPNFACYNRSAALRKKHLSLASGINPFFSTHLQKYITKTTSLPNKKMSTRSQCQQIKREKRSPSWWCQPIWKKNSHFLGQSLTTACQSTWAGKESTNELWQSNT